MFQILVIDDDTAVQELLRRTLKKQGYEVTVASNGEDGVAQAQKLRPALIICDWIMPRLTGIDVCRRVKADPELSTTQFFLLTSLGSIADRVKGLERRCRRFYLEADRTQRVTGESTRRIAAAPTQPRFKNCQAKSGSRVS